MQDAEDQGYRYERKFRLDNADPHQVLSSVMTHPGMFSEVYRPRTVNNLYMDSVDFQSYAANIEGVPDRTKVRVRWYGQRKNKVEGAVLEFKIKRSFAGKKSRFPIAVFVLDQRFCSRYFRNVLEASQLPHDVVTRLAPLNVVLLNRYYRSYYLSADRTFRLTIDSDFEYCKITRLHNNFLARTVKRRGVVVELKYDLEDDGRAERITSAFPFRVTKNSKYVEGIESVWG